MLMLHRFLDDADNSNHLESEIRLMYGLPVLYVLRWLWEKNNELIVTTIWAAIGLSLFLVRLLGLVIH